MRNKKILTINPGSTSTKLALFSGEERILSSSISHSTEEISKFPKIIDQKEYRTNMVLNFLKENDIELNTLDAVVGRGGLLTPLKSGTYEVNREMVDYLAKTPLEHASNLGAIIALSITESHGIPAYIVDPVVVDEMDDIARVTGIPEIERKSIFHALNQKAAAREAAKSLGQKYEDCNLIVAHLGGGISIGAHKQGLVVDVNNALNGDGPFSPERAGSVPAWSLVEMATCGDYTLGEMKKKLTGKGGIVAHLGTNDLREVNKMIESGDQKAEMVFDAMAYNVAKEIASLSPIFKGNLDAIVLTGGIAHNKDFIKLLQERVEFLAPVKIFPGEDEMAALCQGGLRVLTNEEEVKTWTNSGGKG